MTDSPLDREVSLFDLALAEAKAELDQLVEVPSPAPAASHADDVPAPINAQQIKEALKAEADARGRHVSSSVLGVLVRYAGALRYEQRTTLAHAASLAIDGLDNGKVDLARIAESKRARRRRAQARARRAARG